MPERYEHTGNAVATTLTNAVGTGDTSLIIASATGWPTGAVGKFWLVLDRGLATEEKVLALSRSGTTITVSARGADGTSAFAHAIGATVEHNFSATEADDASAHIMGSTDRHGIGAASAVMGTQTVQTPINKSMSGANNTFSAIPQSAVTSLVSDLAGKLAAAAVHDAWEAIVAAAPGTNWAAALAAALDADAATVLGAMATGWPAILGAAPGANWAAALAAALDADAATVLGAMGAGWPATLAVPIADLRPSQGEDSTSNLGETSTTYVAGSPTCGTTFIAPPSGRIRDTVTARMEQNIDGQIGLMSYEIRTGGTIGSGTIILAADDVRAVETSKAVNTGSESRIQASRRRLTIGLVAGDTYNVRTMHRCTGGSMDVFFRAILVEPVL